MYIYISLRVRTAWCPELSTSMLLSTHRCDLL